MDAVLIFGSLPNVLYFDIMDVIGDMAAEAANDGCRVVGDLFHTIPGVVAYGNIVGRRRIDIDPVEANTGNGDWLFDDSFWGCAGEA